MPTGQEISALRLWAQAIRAHRSRAKSEKEHNWNVKRPKAQTICDCKVCPTTWLWQKANVMECKRYAQLSKNTWVENHKSSEVINSHISFSHRRHRRLTPKQIQPRAGNNNRETQHNARWQSSINVQHGFGAAQVPSHCESSKRQSAIMQRSKDQSSELKGTEPKCIEISCQELRGQRLKAQEHNHTED